MGKTVTIGLAGGQCAGKSTMARWIATRFGEEDVFAWRGSDLLRDILRQRALPLTPENYSALAESLRQKNGGFIIADEMFGDVTELARRPPILIHDGLRWVPTAQRMYQLFGDFKLVYLDASMTDRFRRSRALTEGKDDRAPIVTWEAFLMREALPSERELPQLRDMADLVINTEDGLAKTVVALDDALNQWLS